MALFQSIKMAIAYKKQTALQTALTGTDMWALRHTNQDVPQPVLNTEDDAADLGKGPYKTQLFKTSADSSFPIAGFLTSEWAAMLACFGTGKRTKSAAGTGFKYTCTAPVFDGTDPLEMPSTTLAVKIADTGGAVTDKALIGLACEEFGFQWNSGVGRQNAQFTSQWIGCGKYTNPSGITFPGAAVEHNLNSGGFSTLTILGINYLTNNRFISAAFNWKNNIRQESGYFPGSGTQNGFQLRGRMRRGTPQITMSVVAEAVVGSTEEDALLNQTEGTAVLQVDGALIGAGPEKHSLKITLHRVTVQAVPLGQVDGIVTYQMEIGVLEHASNGVATIEVVCEQDNILS